MVGFGELCTKHEPSRSGRPVHLPLDQTPWSSVLRARTEGNPAALLPVLNSEVRRLDANLPVLAEVRLG
jgi:hypothetical protein